MYIMYEVYFDCYVYYRIGVFTMNKCTNITMGLKTYCQRPEYVKAIAYAIIDKGYNLLFVSIQGYLDKLHQDIAKTQEKISSREKYINQQVLQLVMILTQQHLFMLSLSIQLEGQVHTFRTTNDELAQVREKYKQSSGSVNELVQQLNQVRIVIIMYMYNYVGRTLHASHLLRACGCYTNTVLPCMWF